MKLAIMQPYFFPYLGYFDLINACDMFVVYDTVQFIKQGWINRNRILHPNSGWQYITVPVKKKSFHQSYRTPIEDVRVSENIDWRQRIVGQLQHYRRFAPNFPETMGLIEECFAAEISSISRLDVAILTKVCDLLDIDFSYEYRSELESQTDSEHDAQTSVLELCRRLGAKRYLNLPGGQDLYDDATFRNAGVALEFRPLPCMTYKTEGYKFHENLSIIDVLMWNKPSEVKHYLEKYHDNSQASYS